MLCKSYQNIHYIIMFIVAQHQLSYWNNVPKVRYEFIMYLSTKQKLKINQNAVYLRQYQKWETQIIEKFPRSSARENRRIVWNSVCKCKDFFTNVLYVIEKLFKKKDEIPMSILPSWHYENGNMFMPEI